jgi:hypothetical protein
MTGAARAATHARIYQEPPQIEDADGTCHWITRAANFAVVFSHAEAGNVMARADNTDEYMVLLPPGTEATIEAGKERIEAKGDSFTIVPPGTSRVTVTKPGIVVRVFSNRAEDIVAAAGNASTYADGAPEVAPLRPWPDPVGGFRLRHYRLAELPSQDPSPLKMRVFQSSNLMINILERWPRPRDETKLSPHSHDDFEQASLGLEGAFTHHLRYPWTPDKAQWRDDEHAHYPKSPSVLIIPARVVHTSQNVGSNPAWLIDIFAPPRSDFASRPGFVVNGKDYPMPPRS